MTSVRPETSTPSSTSEPATQPKAEEVSTWSSKSYVPNVFDLVYPTGRIRSLPNLSIPPEFLQSDAVDSSVLIGSGASFTVSRQAIPQASSDRVVTHRKLGALDVTDSQPVSKRPLSVVYKSARVRFQGSGEPATAEDGRAMLSVLTELHALLHPPLREHPNIITLLGLAWGSNYADPLHRLPVLVVEYGDRGTLADVQVRSPLFSKAVKVDLCLGVASGLQALHEQGIVHGDLKPENIIICSGDNSILVPKLADFGFAIIEPSTTMSKAVTSMYIAGTRTWRAPESFNPVPLTKLKLTDVYSFGLVVWSIATQVNDPFSLVLSKHETFESRFKEIDRLKSMDGVLSVSMLDNWFLAWLLKTTRTFKASENDKQNTQATMSQLMQSGQKLAAVFETASPEVLQTLRIGMKTLPVYAGFLQSFFPLHLDQILACTLQKDPDKRYLDIAINLLKDQTVQPSRRIEAQSGTALNLENKPTLSAAQISMTLASPGNSPTQSKSAEPVKTISDEAGTHQVVPIWEKGPSNAPEATLAETTKSKIDWYNLGFKSHMYSWQVIRDLEPLLQKFVVKSLPFIDDATRHFVFSACLVNGYGIELDGQRAVNAMIQAANSGHALAVANLYRLSIVCGKPLTADIPVQAYLKRAALLGSRQALLDLCQLNAAEGKHHRDLLRFGYGGVGANWFAEDQWLFGLKQGSFLDPTFEIETLGPRKTLSSLVVNLRGDHIIHAAAAVGAYTLLKTLLEDGTLDVNTQNVFGETAILCACRSGHATVVLLLLNNGADASLQALNGETPLHWLSSFDPTVNPAMVGKDLIERGGAQVNAFTNQRISHSAIFNSIDVDIQMPGTPLGWAVHENNHHTVAFLLSKGADPNLAWRKTDITPLEWAAFLHHVDCLKLMIEHLEGTEDAPHTTEGKKDIRYTVVYGPLIRQAIHAADTFSMVLRNGVRCLNMLESTLLYLKEKTKRISFTLGPKETLIHFTAQRGHSEAVRCILKHDWLVDQINLPTGENGRTAILESVRQNNIGIFRVLLKHGADPRILSASPYTESETNRTWSALHLFADQGHDENMTIVDELIAAGVPVDGNPTHDIETPLSVSIRRNAFRLSNHLLASGASLETTFHSSALIYSQRKLTILGHTIARNARNSFSSLQYLLDANANFMVCPTRGLTALHLCALVPDGLTYHGSTTSVPRHEFDTTTNRNITRMILTHFADPTQIDQRTYNIVPESMYAYIEQETGDLQGTLEFFTMNGETALHLAVEVGNLNAIELLVASGADTELVCFNETLRFETPVDIAERVWSEGQPELYARIMGFLES